MSYSTHENAILLLLTSSDPVTLLVRHEPPPPGLKVEHKKCVRLVIVAAMFEQAFSKPLKVAREYVTIQTSKFIYSTVQ